jgi:hypothetical protein
MKVTPIENGQSKITTEKDNNKSTPWADRLLGIAANLGDITLDEIRAERLAKYL